MEKQKSKQPELWRSVSAGILRRIYDGSLVLASAVPVHQTYEHLLPGSVVLVPTDELLYKAAHQLDQAQGQHERAVWQQVIESLPSGGDGEWGCCRYCGRLYKLPRFHARRDLCSRTNCHKKADAERQRKKYRSSPAVRRKKKAAVARRRRLLRVQPQHESAERASGELVSRNAENASDTTTKDQLA